MKISQEDIDQLRARLAIIDSDIAACLSARVGIRTQPVYRANEQRLHELYVEQYDIKADLARCTVAMAYAS